MIRPYPFIERTLFDRGKSDPTSSGSEAAVVNPTGGYAALS